MTKNAKIDETGKWTAREYAIAVAIIGIPLWLTVILCLANWILERRESERSYDNVHQQYTLTPEERHRFGLDRMPGSPLNYVAPPDAGKRVLEVYGRGTQENMLIEKLSHGDYKDFYDYYDGAEGTIGDVDFDEIGDYFGGGKD